LTLMPVAARPVCAQSPVEESRLKAAFLYRFAQFVEWPSDATASAASVNLCVSGPGVSRAFLAELAAGETLAGKPVAVHDATSDNVTDCHLLFLHTDDGPCCEKSAHAPSSPSVMRPGSSTKAASSSCASSTAACGSRLTPRPRAAPACG
jgi:hypothetical protein